MLLASDTVRSRGEVGFSSSPLDTVSLGNTSVASAGFFIKLKIFTKSIAANKVKNHLTSVKYGVEHKIITIHE